MRPQIPLPANRDSLMSVTPEPSCFGTGRLTPLRITTRAAPVPHAVPAPLREDNTLPTRIGCPVGSDARARSTHIASNRSMLTRQLRACFDPEIDGLTPSDAADLIAVLDSLTSPEAFELMTRAHARTHQQIARAWQAGLLALMDNCYIWGLTPDVTPSTPKGKQ